MMDEEKNQSKPTLEEMTQLAENQNCNLDVQEAGGNIKHYKQRQRSYKKDQNQD